MRGALRQRFLLARAQLAGQFDDRVFLRQLALLLQPQQQVRGQAAGAGAELHHPRQALRHQWRELARQRAREERAQFRCRDEIAAVAGIAPELGRAAAVIAQAGRVQCQRHIAVKADPAAGRIDRFANTGRKGIGSGLRVGGGKG
ncbi:hypothetical protein D3C72_1334950 [compost metagenome]